MKQKGKKQTAPEVREMVVTMERLRGRRRLTYGAVTMDELIALLRDGDHRDAVETLRRLLPGSRGETFGHEEIWHVARVCPAGVFKKRSGKLVVTRMNGLLLLDVQNVYAADEAERVKARAAKLPMTVAAFVGSSAMSVKVLVRYWPEGNCVPRSFEELEALHAEAYRQAVAVYGTLLGHPVTEPKTQSVAATFRLSIDPAVVYRPEAQPMPVEMPSEFSTSPLASQPQADIADGVPGALSTEVPPADGGHYAYYNRRFMQARGDVLGRFRDEGRDPSFEPQAFLEAITARCFALQIPVAEARMRITADETPERQVEWGHYINDFYAARSEDVAPKGKMAQGVREMARLLAANYEIYRNAIDGGLYCRRRTTNGRWEALSIEKQRGLELEVLEAGVLNSTKPVQTFLQSDRIPRRNPVREFLDCVKGKWDEHDRITEVARCVADGNPLWERAFHIWFLAMVRQWMGLQSDHGNDVMPLLCGPQGTGKSTFCRTLLPEELRWGYLDHIDLTKRTELMRLMAQTLLINIDEFDQYRGDSQRGPLKNLLQQVDVRERRKYHSDLEIRQRLASFIATCNPTEVLVDETGSRRFICVRVERFIQLPSDLDRRQLYAQAVDEINMRRLHPDAYDVEDPFGRCYFTDTEREDVERSNSHFRVQSVAVERFRDMFEPLPMRHVKGSTTGVELTRTEILEYLQRHTEKTFSQEDRKQLYACLERLVDEEKLFKRRSNQSYKYHLKRRSQPII